MSSAGAHIQQRRKAVGLSQAALAAKIGVDKSFLSLVENGRRNPTTGLAGTAMLTSAAERLTGLLLP